MFSRTLVSEERGEWRKATKEVGQGWAVSRERLEPNTSHIKHYRFTSWSVRWSGDRWFKSKHESWTTALALTCNFRPPGYSHLSKAVVNVILCAQDSVRYFLSSAPPRACLSLSLSLSLSILSLLRVSKLKFVVGYQEWAKVSANVKFLHHYRFSITGRVYKRQCAFKYYDYYY
jgi:hypothetical protein